MLAAQAKPDHATLARFVERHQDALAERVRVGARAVREGGPGRRERGGGRWQQGLGQREPRGDGRLRAFGARGHRARPGRDAEEDERFGDRRGDELPPEVATSNGRRQWFREARRWLDDQRAEQAAPIPRDRPKRVKEAKRRMDEQLFTEMRAEAAYQRYRARGVDRRGGRLGPNTVPKPYVAPPVPQGTINTTDLDSQPGQGPARLAAGLQRPSRDQRAPDRHRGRDPGRLTRLRAPGTDRHRRPPRARRRSASPNAQGRSSRTPATGMPSRCNASPPTASRS